MRSRGRKPGGTGYRPAFRPPPEENAVRKDWGGRLPVALVYPNSYYLGMSNLGVHALYRLLNDEPDALGERVFRERGGGAPVSIESGRPLTDFPVIAFSVSYELDYFAIPAILHEAGIPVHAAARDETHPLVIGGGPCLTANPMPVAPFFDAFGIGEGEVLLPPLLPVLQEGIGGARDALLDRIAALPGWYVPARPPREPVVRQYLKDLDTVPTTSVVLTRETELGDLFLVEAERGCQRGCRFCLVNGTFSPMRFRSAGVVLRQAEEGMACRRRIGLVGPAVTDHPQILEILGGLNDRGAEIAVSSLRISSLSGDLIAALARGGAKTITMAPEAGSQRLRDAIHKGITGDDIFRTVDEVTRHRFTQVKLYFIVGLPGETDGDVRDIGRLALGIRERLDRGGSARLTLNVAPFVPKAGTPFQWLPMAPEDVLEERLAILRADLPRRGIKLNAESPAWSRVQAALARGDERLAAAIAGTEKVSLAGWRKAVTSAGLDLDYYVNNRWDTETPLPWAAVSGSSRPEHLCAELERALEG